MKHHIMDTGKLEPMVLLPKRSELEAMLLAVPSDKKRVKPSQTL